MSGVSPDTIGPVLDALVGATGMNGDTAWDDESMRNVGKLGAVCDWVCDRIGSAYSGDYPGQCASAERVASRIRRASIGILDCMGIDPGEILAIADEIEDAREGFGRGYAERIREALGVRGES